MQLDPKPTRRHGVGGPARGYKFHAVWMMACEVETLGVSEQTVARRGVDLMAID